MWRKKLENKIHNMKGGTVIQPVPAYSVRYPGNVPDTDPSKYYIDHLTAKKKREDNIVTVVGCIVGVTLCSVLSDDGSSVKRPWIITKMMVMEQRYNVSGSMRR